MIKPDILKQNARIIARTIPFLAMFFIGFIAWRSFKELPDYQWSIKQLWWLLGAIFLYPFSLVIMLFNWHQIMRNLGANISKLPNFYIYCMNVAVKRLPMGLLWSTGGRVALYANLRIKKHIALGSVLLELALHTLSAFIIWIGLELLGYGFIKYIWAYFRFNRFIPLLLTIFTLFFLIGIYAWRRWRRQILQVNIVRNFNLYDVIRWLIMYSFTWFIAGAMLWAVVHSISPSSLTIFTCVAVWAFVGFLGHLFSTFPFIDIGTKEITLTLILSQFISLGQAAFVAIIFRLLLTLSDATIPLAIALLISYAQKKLSSPEIGLQ